MRVFDANDTATWPITLTVHQVALIYQRAVGGVRKSCQLHRFVPAPFMVQPYRWRKVDVVRHVEGARGLQRSA